MPRLLQLGVVYIGNRTSEVVTWGLVSVWVGSGIFYGLSTDFMNNIPEHVDAVPRSVMNTIVSSAETCGMDSDTFIFAWNVPEEEWVQDLIIRYYLYDTPVTGITLSRIINDSDDELTNRTGLMPDAIIESDNTTRYRYFTDDAERVFMFQRPTLPIEASMNSLEELLEADGFVQCPYISREDLTANIYTRNSDNCEVIIQSCGQ